MSLLWEVLPQTLAAILGLMFALWIVSLVRRDASLVDPFWSLGFVIVAWLAYWLNSTNGSSMPPRTLLLLSLITLWGLRLSAFLTWRNWGHGEDRRYGKMREHHGARFWWVSLFTIFLLQGTILWFVAWAVQVPIVSSETESLSVIDLLGVLLWSVGFIFETVGDWQLARFKADGSNAGKVLDRGLWRYTRHPNYFGDFCVWWGLYAIAMAGGAWWTIGSPLVMSVLLMKISGVSLLESTITERRPEYAKYQAQTNAFFPGPPRKT